MSNTHAPQSSTSPPLPNLHSLAISPYPGASAAASGPNSAGAGPGAGPGAGGLHGGGGGGGGGGNQGSDYRYNGVFGPPVPGHTPGWSSPNKRGSRSGLPTNWFDPTARESPHPPFESYRHSPPTLSPPSSTTSGPNSAHAYPYPGTGYNTLEPGSAFNMTISPSPPPMIGGYSGIPSAGSAPNLTGYNSSGMPQYGTQSLASLTNRNGLSGLNGMWSRGAYGSGLADDDVIPTAIVIKNIPFAVPREQLLGVIESLGAPLPYAFNYHHDNGIFRGLAFANFRAPDEAASVVAALNGYDVQGRKLRVEYKKVLQPGEKDKIEREKALKRMRSIQFDSAVMKDIPPPLNMMPPPPHPHQQPPPQQHQQQHQHQASHHHSNSQSQSIAINRPSSQQHNGHGNPHLSESYGGVSEAESPPHSASSATSESQNLPMNLDLNDPMALDIYSRVLVFKEDRMRDELAFSKSLTPTERRIVHLVANKLGLMSITKGGEGEVKYVVVTREAAPARPALTSSNSANTGGGSYLSPYGTTQAEVSPSLRIKKSMPDLRGFNGPVVARDPARSLTPQRSSGNLRGDANGQSREYVSMGASSGRRANGLGSGNFNGYFGSPVDGAPPVPPLPTGLGLHASKSSSSVSGAGAGTSPDNLDGRDPGSAPMRNPRGPAGDARGFAIRSNAGGMLRSQQNGPGGFGRALNEEEEEGYDEGQQQHQQQQQETHTPPQPQAQEPEGARTRGEVEV